MITAQYLLFAAALGLSFGIAAAPFMAGSVLDSYRIRLDYAVLAALTGAVVVRWLTVGHPPVFGTFENSMASAWALLLAVTLNDHGRVGPSDVLYRKLMGMWVPFTLAYGLVFRSAPLPLTISERSLWIDVHVLFAWTAYTVMISGCTAAVAYLLAKEPDSRLALEGAVLRGAAMGFAFFTGVIVVGALYSYQLFAVFFKWEIVLTMSVTTWLGLSLVVHARLLFGWGQRRLAWAMVMMLPLIIASYWGWSMASTYHFFDIVPVKAF